MLDLPKKLMLLDQSRNRKQQLHHTDVISHAKENESKVAEYRFERMLMDYPKVAFTEKLAEDNG